MKLTLEEHTWHGSKREGETKLSLLAGKKSVKKVLTAGSQAQKPITVSGPFFCNRMTGTHEK